MQDIPNFYLDISDDLKLGAEKILERKLFKYNFDLSNISNYVKDDKIGQGTFGEVFKMKHIKTNGMYALKRIKYENESEGFPITSLREVKILQSLDHENIVRLKEICWNHPSPSTRYRAEFYLTFELCNHDLAGILSFKGFTLELPFKKTIMYHILKGLEYLHRNDIIHRDIKTSNILIDPNGIVKIADFGLARLTKSKLSMTNRQMRQRFTGRVVTLWYRAPEILLNLNDYDYAVDMWSAGCVFAELWKKEAILPGRTEANQLSLIIQLCGMINEKVWPGFDKIEEAKKLNLKTAEETFNQSSSTALSTNQQPNNLNKTRLARYIDNQDAIELIDKLLILYPPHRITAFKALKHDVFLKPPDMGKLTEMKLTTHCYEYKMHKQNAEMEHLQQPPMKQPRKDVKGGGGGLSHQQQKHQNNNSNSNNNSNHTYSRSQQHKVFKDHLGVCERKY